MSQAYHDENPAEVDRWLRRCDEVLALLDCALRGCRSGSRPVVEEALAGARRIQAQKQFVEAWLALCRFLGEGTVFDRLERLTKWMSANQLPSND